MSFGGDTKSRRSLLSGVYARGSKRPHQSARECVTVVDSTAHSKNSPRSASMRRKTLPCTEKGRRRRSCGIRLQNKFAVRKVNTLHQPSRKIKATRLLCGKKLKEVLPNKQKIAANSLLSQHGEVVDDLADIADIFNEHFSTVGEHLVSNATPRGLVDDNIHLTRINSLDVKCTLPDIGREGNWSGWNKCKNVANIIEVYNKIFNPHIQSLDKVRTLPKRLEIKINVIKLTITLFPYCQLSPKSWSDGYIQ